MTSKPSTLILTYADGHQVTIPGVDQVDTTGQSLVCWSDSGVCHEPGMELVGVEVWEEEELEPTQ